MTAIPPPEAIEAAAEAMFNDEHAGEGSWPDVVWGYRVQYRRRAEVSIIAAMPVIGVETHNHGLICQPQETLQCRLCGETYFICKVCHRDVYGHHAKCEARR